MAPEPRRRLRENQFPFELGVRGRKTGITVPDSGIRDEHGLETTDHLFSSPAKSRAPNSGRKEYADATLSSDEMDEVDSTVPEPTAVLTSRKSGSMILPPPKGKSPIKTYLRSPARRNPSLGPVSSPVRGSIVDPRPASVSASVRRRLDFSLSGHDESLRRASPLKRRSDTGSTAHDAISLAKPILVSKQSHESVNDYEDDIPDQVGVEDDVNEETQEPLYQATEVFDEEEILPEQLEVTAEQSISRNKKGRRKSVRTNSPELAVEEPRAEESKVAVGGNFMQDEEFQSHGERPKKRQRRSNNSGPKKSQKDLMATAKEKKPRRDPRLAKIDETSAIQVQRGPPLPRRSGLLMVRRETPLEGVAFKQTRSGRNSFKPLAYWKNEKVEYSDDEVEDSAGNFLVPRLREVVRVEEDVQGSRRTKRSKSTKSRRQVVESDDEIPAEPWETEPGRLYGDVLSWDPDDPSGALAEEREDEIALSSAAIITREIADASFKFAKTLTLPFFGSGVVDLPPGSIKRTKNSRKMQMAFFVFTGRVKVIVNGNEFRISKGGMFQVPRGNTYSIENDYENEARIFFSQGCEVLLEDVDE